MAHVNMYNPSDSGILRSALEAYSKRRNVERELETRESINTKQIGAQLQQTRQKLDTDLEIAKMNISNQRNLAKFRAGIDAQLKQMGIDLDLELQKLRNMNAREIAEFNAMAAQILESLRDEKKQAQILKEYQTQLKLHNYDAQTALYRTYLSVMGDIYKTGDPISNAADAAAFGIWSLAWKLAYGTGLDVPKDAEIGTLDKKVDLGTNGSKEISNEEVDKLIKALKGESIDEGNEHRAPGSKITKHAEPRLKTKIQLMYNQRAGQPHVYKR